MLDANLQILARSGRSSWLCSYPCLPTAHCNMQGAHRHTVHNATAARKPSIALPAGVVCRQPARVRLNRRQNLACQVGATDVLPALDPVAVTNAAYWGLGLAGASFVGTFLVAPQFKDSFKENLDWKDIYYALQSTGVKSVEASEAFAKSRSSGGAVLVDVRLGNKYEALHAQGSLSIPLYNPIQDWELPSVIRRLGFAFFGIYGTGVLLLCQNHLLQRA
eukprot:GHRR01032351.1.p1 GENE.GHRR01032351.1~~GHRR01032351.1.p1  ORF type:complete len:220 (+),score=37.83 GHRR01032351.1:346-1005(+)